MDFAQALYNSLLFLMLLVAPFVLLILFYIPAPYGRYARPGWGPTIDNRWGWSIMESPAALLMLIPIIFISENLLIYFFLFLWQAHYLHRAFIYPFNLKSEPAIPLSIVGLALLFNFINAFLNGYYFSVSQDTYNFDYIYNWNFSIGLILFLVGFWANKRSDRVLQKIKKENGSGHYETPDEFLYRYISCPNYFSESVQWLGWAVMTMAPPAWIFFLWTLANLLPRAVTHHRWYQENFPNYPKKRKALFPFLI